MRTTEKVYKDILENSTKLRERRIRLSQVLRRSSSCNLLIAIYLRKVIALRINKANRLRAELNLC